MRIRSHEVIKAEIKPVPEVKTSLEVQGIKVRTFCCSICDNICYIYWKSYRKFFWFYFDLFIRIRMKLDSVIKSGSAMYYLRIRNTDSLISS